MADDGNRQVAVALSISDVSLSSTQFEALDTKLGGIDGAINKLAENIAEPDTNVAAEIQSLKQELVVGFAGINQSIANLNNVIFERSADLAKWLAAIALAASTPEDNSAEVQKKVDELTALLKPEADAFEQAAKPEGE
jgi:SMC interacting uncharacterized protein involved in chromosome segregation